MDKSSALGGIGRALQGRNYRLYFIGSAASNLGFWTYQVALIWLTWELTHSAAWLAVMAASALLPAVFLTPITGAIGDRLGLRRVSAVALMLLGVTGLTLGVLHLAGLIDVYLLLPIVIARGFITAFELPSRQALVPALVERQHLSSAITLNTTTFHASAFLGPILFSLVDVTSAFFIDGVTFFVYGILMTRLRLDQEVVGRRSGGGILDDTIEGFRYVLGHPGILALFFTSAMTHLLVRPYQPILPAFAEEVFGQDKIGYSMLQASAGLGAILAGLFIAYRGRTAGATWQLIIASLCSMLALLVFASTNIFFLGLGALFLVGMFQLTSGVSSQTLMQNTVAPAVRGRVIGLSTGMAIGLPAIGGLILGPLGKEFGVQLPFIVAMIVGVIGWSWIARRLYRHKDLLEKMPD